MTTTDHTNTAAGQCGNTVRGSHIEDPETMVCTLPTGHTGWHQTDTTTTRWRSRAEADLEQARRTIATQAAEIRRASTLVGRIRDLQEQLDRALVEYDTVEPETGAAGLGSPGSRAQGVLAEVAAERARQDARWGEQNHPDGTGQYPETIDADVARMACQSAAEGGYLDWLHILREEVAEAFASTGADLRTELVQVAAVAVAWVEAIDRRTGPVVGDGRTKTGAGVHVDQAEG